MQEHNPNFSRLVPYYHREMNYLLKAGAKFAKVYPKIAGNLDLSSRGSDDPHVARLIESFAFLSARLQLEADDQFAQLSQSLLQILYPDFAQPFPSCSIAKLRNDVEAAALFKGSVLPRDTELLAETKEGVSCRFQTTMDTSIWPLDVVNVSYVAANLYDMPTDLLRSPWLLKVTLCSHGGPLKSMPIDDLCFYLGGDTLTSFVLMRWLYTYDPEVSIPVLIQPVLEDKKLTPLPFDAFERVGFEVNEGLLPASLKTLPTQRLLWDFFHFPQKFLFFKVKKLKKFITTIDDHTFNLYFPLSIGAEPENWPLSAENIQLGCVPVVNLFQKTSEPIRLDEKKSAYRLVPSYRLEHANEIHSILSVSSASRLDLPGDVMEPFFAYTHESEFKKQSIYWLANRTQTFLEGGKGTDVFLSFVDYNLNVSSINDQVVYAHMLCTNRRLAEKLPVGAHLDVHGDFLGLTANMLMKPSKALMPALEGEAQWLLISHLSLDHLGLCAHAESFAPLKEMLNLYKRSEASLGFAIEAFESVEIERSVGALSQKGWQGFVPMLSVILRADDKKANIYGFFILSMILNELFRSSADFNTLVETKLVGSANNLIKKWAASPCIAQTL